MGHVVVVDPAQLGLLLLAADVVREVVMAVRDADLGEATVVAAVSEHEGDATYSPQFFSLDNQFLYYLTDEGSDFVYLAKRDLGSGEVTKEYETDWDVWYAYDSWNEKYRVILRAIIII